MNFYILFSILIQLDIFHKIIIVKCQKSKGLNFKIDEESPENSYIGSLELLDCGRPTHSIDGRNSHYRLVSENKRFLTYIEINRFTGKMTLRHTIDRDTMCEKLQLCCNKVLDRVYVAECIVQLKAVVEYADADGSPLSTGYCNVNVEIDDINDNSPTFSPDKFIINISEAAHIDSIFSLPLAQDADSSKFSVSRYYLKETSRYFRIEYNQDNSGLISPKLLIKSRLDREEISEHQLSLIAVDTGVPPKSGSLNLIIRILDENDNEPIIEQLTPISVKEDVQVGHYITRIQAHDKDSGDNALLSYTMIEHSTQNGGNHFKLNQETGEITLIQKIDYDIMHHSPQIELIITVKDHGKPKELSSSTTLTISIVDVNDEIPKISVIDLYSRQPAKPEIRENLLHNQFVAFVNVRDADHGINGQIKCELLGDQTDFSLEHIEHNTLKDRYEYKLITKSRLDCEKQSMYKLIINCNDMGQPKQSSQEEVTVKVIDINDNSPTFGNSRIELELEENQLQGTLVATLNVTDLDETDRNNGQFQYIMSDNGKRYFRIEPIEGRGKDENAKLRIYTMYSFDREKTSTVEFEIIVKDVSWGSSSVPFIALSSTATIVVTILDINDNVPLFSKSQYEFTIIEEKPPGQFVGLIQATDEDFNNNGKVIYKIEDYSNTFALDLHTGTLITKIKIDREKISVFEFKVRASDQGRPSKSNIVSVVIKVNDVNDNDPKFIYPTSENHTVLASVFNSEGSLIMKVNAIDNDEAGKNQITYNIDNGDENNLFQIDPIQGGISFTRKPKSTDAKSYFLTIKVSDNDFPIRFSKITIHLKLDESRLPFLGQDYRRNNNQGEIDEQSWIENQNRNKFPINRNILLVICLIVISATLAGVLLMLIMCLKKRPQANFGKTPNHLNYYSSESNKNTIVGAYKNDPSNASNMTLNYRMVPSDKYQDLVHTSTQDGYSGLSFFRKNTNINNFNDQSLNLMTDGFDGYQWINNSSQPSTSIPSENVYHKIIPNTDISTTATRKAIVGEQILSIRDDAPNFISNYGCGADQVTESQSRAIHERYQTIDPKNKTTLLSTSLNNETEKNLLDHGSVNFVSPGTPKRSFIASSFV